MEISYYSFVYETLKHEKYIIDTFNKNKIKEQAGPLSRIDRGTTKFDSKADLADYLFEKGVIPDKTGLFYIVRTGTKRRCYFEIQYSGNYDLSVVSTMFDDSDKLYEDNPNYLSYIDYLKEATTLFFDCEKYRRLFSRFKKGREVLHAYYFMPDYDNVMKTMEKVLKDYESFRFLLIESKRLEKAEVKVL